MAPGEAHIVGLYCIPVGGEYFSFLKRRHFCHFEKQRIRNQLELGVLSKKNKNKMKGVQVKGPIKMYLVNFGSNLILLIVLSFLKYCLNFWTILIFFFLFITIPIEFRCDKR